MSSECETKSLRRTSKGMSPLSFGSRLMRENRISLVNAVGMVCSEMAAESVPEQWCLSATCNSAGIFAQLALHQFCFSSGSDRLELILSPVRGLSYR